MKDPYRVLDVDRRASASEVHAAYLRHAKACHPDLHRDLPDAEARFRNVVEAYQAITAERMRHRDDAERLRARRAAAEAGADRRRRWRPRAATGEAAVPGAGRRRQTDGLIISLLWFLAVMVILAVV